MGPGRTLGKDPTAGVEERVDVVVRGVEADTGPQVDAVVSGDPDPRAGVVAA